MPRDGTRRDLLVIPLTAGPTVPRRRIRERIRTASGTPVDVAILASITLLAAALRFWHLGTVPLGLHGDEAWTGLDARRVLNEGWIGPYVPSALGQPAGPLYLTALFFRMFPQTTTTLRASMALVGVATIPLAYLAFSAMFDRTVGAFSSFLLAVMMWHLHLSRTAFMVIAWPFAEVAALWVLWLALRRTSPWWFGAAGAILALGVYTYNADLLFLPVPFAALAAAIFNARTPGRRRRLLAGVPILTTACVLVASPMIVFAIRHPETYRHHEHIVSVTGTERWDNASAFGKARIIADRAGELVRGLAIGGRPDLGDGLATRGHPVIDTTTLLLAGVGLVMTARAWRTPESAAIAAALVLLPWGALLTIEDGLFRRTLGLAPFVALLAALPLAWLWRGICRLPDKRRPLLLAVVLATLALNAGWTSFQYFGPVQHTGTMEFVYPHEMDAASYFIKTLPLGTRVYFYSERWSFDYETRRFIAPDAVGEDRSREFGGLTIGGQPNLGAATSGRAAFIFLGDYLGDANEAAQRYPGGVFSQTERRGAVEFRAYVVDIE